MASNEFQAGHRLGPYTIEAVVGQGASAVVYRANDPRFGGPVAIKVLASHLASDVEAVERFSGEARALRAVDNDAVVSVYDIAQTDDHVPYMVLALADRGTLEDRLSLGRPATATELRTLLSFFERSLGALHERGLVHRDVKPSNVLLATATGVTEVSPPASFGLLRPDDRLVLGDLGLVKDTTVGRALTRGAGTHSYAAPEQRAVVSHVTTRSDLYAASAVIAEATIGRVREPDESWEDISAQISQLGRPVFANALNAGFAEDPDERPVDVAEWASRLRSALAASDPETEHPGGQRSIDGNERTAGGFSLDGRSGKAAAVVALCVALIAASVLLFSSPTEDASSVSTGPGPDATARPTATTVPDTGGTPDPGGASGSAGSAGAAPTATSAAQAGSAAPDAADPSTTLTPTPSPDDEVLSERALPDGDSSGTSGTNSETSDPVDAASDPPATTPSPTAEVATVAPTASPTAADIRSGAGSAPTATSTATATATATPDPSPTPSPSQTPTPSPTPAVIDIRDVDCATAGSTTVAGPAQGLTVVATTASTATLSWSARDIPMSIFVGPQYLDNISVGANLYVAEGLDAGQDSIISIADHDTIVDELVGKASIVCAVSDASIPGPPQVGPIMATDLAVVEGSVTSTTATLQWTPAIGGGRYTMWTGDLVPGQRFPRLNPVGAGGSPVGATSFEFTDLPPASEVVIGLRTIIEPNQSNLAWITVTTPP